MCVAKRGVPGGAAEKSPCSGRQRSAFRVPWFFQSPFKFLPVLKAKETKGLLCEKHRPFYITAHNALLQTVCVTSSLHTPVGKAPLTMALLPCCTDHFPHLASYYPSRQSERNSSFFHFASFLMWPLKRCSLVQRRHKHYVGTNHLLIGFSAHSNF